MSQQTNTTAHPPKADFIFRVGVTGHRSQALKNADGPALEESIRTALTDIQATVMRIHDSHAPFFSPQKPRFRLISSLADGADQLISEVATSLGFELQAVLPFTSEEYVKDFKDTAAGPEFQELLNRATVIVELDGNRNSEGESYAAAGHLVLDQSDLLLAVWDGEQARGPGGTQRIMNAASNLEVPLIFIEARSPHSIYVETDEGRYLPWSESKTFLEKRLTEQLLPPVNESLHGKEEIDLREAFFAETKKNWNWGFLLNLLLPVVAGFQFFPRLRSHKLPDIPSAGGKLDQHYRWADHLATYYVNVYRAAFVSNYFLGATAVLFAFLGSYLHKDALFIVEFLLIAWIIAVTTIGVKRKWHQRWLEYRVLAEQLRQMKVLNSMSRIPPISGRLPAHSTLGDPRRTWSNWHFRSIIRELGLATTRFDQKKVKSLKQQFKELILDQIRYHENVAKDFHRLQHSTHRAATFLFIVGGIACVIHIVYYILQLHLPDRLHLPLALIALTGPAFAGAITAISMQGEFERLAARSDAMKAQLAEVLLQVEMLFDPESVKQPSVRLGEIAAGASQLMIDELLDWKTVFQIRKLTLPA